MDKYPLYIRSAYQLEASLKEENLIDRFFDFERLDGLRVIDNGFFRRD